MCKFEQCVTTDYTYFFGLFLCMSVFCYVLDRHLIFVYSNSMADLGPLGPHLGPHGPPTSMGLSARVVKYAGDRK